jgi:hypothetical protein
MDGDEIFVALVCGVLAAVGLGLTAISRMPRIYFRDARGIGLTRLATLGALGWIWFVLLKYADPSIQGIYFWFYLLMGYAAVKGFGGLGAQCFGVRFRVDVCERRNPAAALFYAGFVLATGLIFGGCLWGEADPTGDDEGGWWIPVGFFLAGWGAWMLALGLFFWREPGPTRVRIRRDRKMPEARAAATYALVAAWVLTEAVAGDFYGWTHGLVAVGGVAALLVVREIFAFSQYRVVSVAGGLGRTRTWESAVYVLSGVLFWWLNRLLENRLANLT